MIPRERCTRVNHNGSTLADYTWLGNAVSKRETTCDYPGSTKPKFKSDYARDGLVRVTKLTNDTPPSIRPPDIAATFTVNLRHLWRLVGRRTTRNRLPALRLGRLPVRGQSVIPRR